MTTLKHIAERILFNGRRRVTVELAPGERLVAISDDAFYRLGEPMDEVLQGHIIAGAQRVAWCPVEQKWTE